jgi:hypothetical protein
MQRRILRSSQLDAHELDAELHSLFKEKIKDMFKMVQANRWEPEMKAILDWVIYSSLLYRKSTYGLQLQNLIYHGTMKRIRAFVFVRVVGCWFWERFSQFMRDQQWSDDPVDSVKFQIWSRLQQWNALWDSFSLLQFLAFLYTGR